MYSFSGQNIFNVIRTKKFRNRAIFNHKANCKMHPTKCTCSRSNVIRRLFFYLHWIRTVPIYVWQSLDTTRKSLRRHIVLNRMHQHSTGQQKAGLHHECRHCQNNWLTIEAWTPHCIAALATFALFTIIEKKAKNDSMQYIKTHFFFLLEVHANICSLALDLINWLRITTVLGRRDGKLRELAVRSLRPL